MSVLSKFEPAAVLSYFEEMCSIPHGSGNVDKISDYLVQFAKNHNLKYRQDDSKNVIIWKDGTPGYENSDTVIIQGHMDMVAVKTADSEKDLEKEGLDLKIVNDHWLTADKTSLGGDDGIAVAYGLAILASDDIPHPPIELLVTSDEEIGLIGAAALDTSDLKGKTLLNIDSEDEGIFTVSCAGGMTAVGKLPYKKESGSGEIINIRLSGFKGGHSGAEIHLGRLNSNIVLGRLLNQLADTDMRIISVSGGEKDNAISKISEASVLVSNSEEAIALMKKEFGMVCDEYDTVEGLLKAEFTVEKSASAECMTKESTAAVIFILLNIPNGIQRMNPDVEGLVQTSINLGILTTEDNEVVFSSSLRSSVESEKLFLFERFSSIFKIFGGNAEAQGDYPGWAYTPVSRIRDVMVEVYKEQYGEEPKVLGIHAGLECGIFSSKIEGLDCISFGPQMNNIHTTDEELDLNSVARTWELLKETLKRLR